MNKYIITFELHTDHYFTHEGVEHFLKTAFKPFLDKNEQIEDVIVMAEEDINV